MDDKTLRTKAMEEAAAAKPAATLSQLVKDADVVIACYRNYIETGKFERPPEPVMPPAPSAEAKP